MELAQYAYEECRRICWNEAKVLQIEPNTTYSKYKAPTHMILIDHPMNHPSLDMSPIITAKVQKLQLHSV
jgi:hypothetical protein